MSAAPRNFRRATRHNPCPICGHTGWCRRFDDGAVECMWIESEIACRSGGWMHWPNGRPDDSWRDRLALPNQAPPPRERAPLDAAILDQVYGRLLSHCPLTSSHREALRARGLSDRQIAVRAYGSLPGPGRSSIARSLLDEFGRAVMERAPGFFYRTDNRGLVYPMLAGPHGGGIFIPIRDLSGRIVAFQIRRDRDNDRQPRYVWFSSRDLPGGTGSGAPLHVAQPTSRGSSGSAETALVTEGPLKADISADELGCVVLAVPGVSNQAGVLPAVQTLGARVVIIGFDRDAETKPIVRHERDKMATALAAAQITVELAVWDDTYKGLDDALVAGIEPTVGPYPFAADRARRRTGTLVDLSPEAVPAPGLRLLRSLTEAHVEHARRFRDLLVQHQPGFTMIASTTGAGKTDGLARVLAGLAAGDWPQVAKATGPGTRPLRVLYVAQTKEQVTAFQAMTGGVATIVEGRNPDPEHAWGCHRPEVIRILGAQRHNPAVDGCSPCREEYEALHGKGWLCHYLLMKKATAEARLVAAPIGAFFNASSELRNFDVVVVDEAIVPALTEMVVLTRDHLAAWQRRMNEIAAAEPGRYGLDDPFRRFVQALDVFLSRADAIAGEDWEPALPHLREVCDDLDALLERVLAIAPSDGTNRYAFETPRTSGPDRLVPLRLMRDLLEAIDAERPARADTRLWLTREGLRLFRVQEHLLTILRQRTVINLDASPSPSLRRLFPDLEEIRIDVPTPLRVTQVTDTLTTRRQLAKPQLRTRVVAALEAVTAPANSPVIFTFSNFNPLAGDGDHRLSVSNPAAQWGHFDRETRALNRFADADLLCIVGHYSAPLPVLRAEVQGLRFAAEPIDAPAGAAIRLRPYLWRDAAGRGRGRWSPADRDPDVDALIRWSESSTIMQAIGRGRAARRSEDAPLDVFLFTNAPIDDLPIHRLVSLAELGAPAQRRGANDGFQAQTVATAERSIQRGIETERQVRQAIAELRNAGLELTVTAIAERSGVHRRTLYNDRLRAIIEAAQAENAVQTSVGVGTTQRYSSTDPTPTLIQTPNTEAQRALTAADAAHDQPAFRQANADLADRLAEIARVRGREPVPRPASGGSRPVSPPSPHVWQRANLPAAGVDGTAGDDPLDLTRAGPGGF